MKGRIDWPQSTCSGCANAMIRDTRTARHIHCRASQQTVPLDVQWCNRYMPEGSNAPNSGVVAFHAAHQPVLISDKPVNPTGEYI